jgi:hypothetical protein
MAAVPVEFLDATSLLGSVERIRDRMRVLAEVGVTTLTVSPVQGEFDGKVAALRAAVEALDAAGVGG